MLSCNENRWAKLDEENLKNNSIKFVDFDEALINFTKSNLNKLIHEHYKNDEILGYLFLHCLSIGSPEDSTFYKSLELFKSDPYIIELEKQIDYTLRSKLATHQVNLNSKFNRLSYYLKGKTIPKKVFWLNSLFTSSVFCSKHEVGVGLERYIGPNKSVIKKLPTDHFYQWMKDGMKEEFLERDVLVNWIYTHYVPENNGSLVEKMIQWGKVYYILHAIDPDLSFNILMRYQNEKYDWCEKNESQVWKYLVTQSLVFSKNERDISNFINEGPFTPGLPEKGPDRLGQYIGWKMVYKYMNEHDSKSLEDLVNTSYNSILQEYQID